MNINQKNMKRLISGLFIALMMGVICSCGNMDNPKKVTIASVNWAEGVAMTQLAKAILEKQGYTVELKNADVAPVFAAVASGNADVFMDAWAPVTHKEYLDKYKGNLEILGANFKNARIGFVVPDYVDVKSIDGLNANPQHFKGKIVGIDAGAGIMGKAEKAIKAYGLNLELQSSSEAAMLAVLKKSIDKKEPVVITGWAPHYIFSLYKLKFLEDPKGVFGRIETLQTVANQKFAASKPQLVNFFRNFKLDDLELSSLLALLENNNHEKAATEEWIKAHPSFVEKMNTFLKEQR